MKVISILGSPNKNGTSARIAKSFTDEAQMSGAVVKTFYLNEMAYSGCQGCQSCQGTARQCILQDDLTAVLEGMRTADIAIFASPVYYGDTSGQFKTFFDRTCSQLEVDLSSEDPYSSRLPPGKTAVFILSQGEPGDRHTDIIDRYTAFFGWLGYDLKVIRAFGQMEIAIPPDVTREQKQAAKLAKELLNRK